MSERTSEPDEESPDPAASERSGLSIDERFEILKNGRRRLVLEYLLESDGSAELNDLADHVTAVENDTEVSRITSTQRKRVYVGLYQFHLPKMADVGVIEYDQKRGDVRLTERGADLYREHEHRKEPRRRWYLAYLAIAVVGFFGALLGGLVWSTELAVAALAVHALLLAAMATFHAISVHRFTTPDIFG